MIPEIPQKTVDRIMRRLRPELPSWAAEVRAVADHNWDGDPIVRVLFLVPDQDFDSIMPGKVTDPVEVLIRKAFLPPVFEGSVHFHYRTVSEQAELDREECRRLERAFGRKNA